MNKLRRKSLQEIIDKMQEIRSGLETHYDEEREYRDNIPENLQDSERYEISDNAVDALDAAMSDLDSAIENIESAIE